MSDGKNWNASGRMALWVAAFAALAVLYRLVPYLFDLGQQAPWAWNFIPVGAVGLFAGARWRSRFALLAPVAVMLASHLLMWPFLAAKGYATFGWMTPILYGSFMVYALIGRLIRGSSSPLLDRRRRVPGGGSVLSGDELRLLGRRRRHNLRQELGWPGPLLFMALPFFRATLGALILACFWLYALSCVFKRRKPPKRRNTPLDGFRGGPFTFRFSRRKGRPETA